MTDHGRVWFEYLTDAYVQTGSMEVAETYLHGKQWVPNNPNITTGNSPVGYPESFAQDWAWDGTATSAGYDKGAYGIGASVDERTITIPKVKPVHLLYYYSATGTKEERILVQTDVVMEDGEDEEEGTADDVRVNLLGVVNADLSPINYTFEQYVARFAPQGFNRMGFVLPAHMSRSKVSELHSFTGDFIPVGEDSPESLTVYFEPLYINNDLPLFDHIYLQKDVTIPSGTSMVPGYFMRWLGGAPSENIAPINREGTGLVKDGFRIAGDGSLVTPSDTTFSVDGQTFTGAEAYNVRNFRRN